MSQRTLFSRSPYFLLSHVSADVLSPTGPWNSRSRSVLSGFCCSCFPLFPTQRLCPWRAIDFSRVISVFPFIGRKWNNNRGGRENHAVTLGETVWAEAKMTMVSPFLTRSFSAQHAEGDLRYTRVAKTPDTLYSYWSGPVIGLEHRSSLAYFSDMSEYEKTGENHMYNFPLSDTYRKYLQLPTLQACPRGCVNTCFYSWTGSHAGPCWIWGFKQSTVL